MLILSVLGGCWGEFVSCGFPYGPPFRSQMYKEVPPLPILRRSPTEVRGRGRGPSPRPRFSADPFPVRCFPPLGVTRGDLVVDPGGHPSGKPNRARALDLPPLSPPKSTNYCPFVSAPGRPRKPRGPWNVPTTVVRVSLRLFGAPLGSPGGALGAA